MNNEQMLSKLKAVRNQLGPDNLSCWDEDDDGYEAAKSLDEIIVSINQALATEASNHIEQNLEKVSGGAVNEQMLREALEEAMGWNWLDGDVPEDVVQKCEQALASEGKTQPAEPKQNPSFEKNTTRPRRPEPLEARKRAFSFWLFSQSGRTDISMQEVWCAAIDEADRHAGIKMYTSPPAEVVRQLVEALKPFAVFGRVGSRDVEVRAAVEALAAAKEVGL